MSRTCVIFENPAEARKLASVAQYMSRVAIMVYVNLSPYDA